MTLPVIVIVQLPCVHLYALIIPFQLHEPNELWLRAAHSILLSALSFIDTSNNASLS